MVLGRRTFSRGKEPDRSKDRTAISNVRDSEALGPGAGRIISRKSCCEAAECPGVLEACCVALAMCLKGTRRPRRKLEAAQYLLQAQAKPVAQFKESVSSPCMVEQGS